ncbi:MAG: LysR family transcriptional regulator [Deltaproteobacteria bacterium]|nr:LysR family transcriptional regulator [Deltaproteobacteria bacterium]
MLNYNHLYYFHIAASEGSIAAGADRLRVSQATVSEQVRTLERTLHVTLFERHPTGLRLTDAGRLVFEHTSVMFRAGERLTEALGHDQRNLPRVLRIGLTNAVGRATSTDFLIPILAIHDCLPSIRSGDMADLIRDLRGNELDLVLCESEPPAAVRQGLEVALLDRMTLVAVVGVAVDPSSDWGNTALVHYRPTTAFRWEVEAYLDSNQLRPRIAGESDDTLFMVEAAARGGYVAFVPRSVARDAVVSGRVKVVGTLVPEHAAVHALYQGSSTTDLASRAVDALVEHVRAMHAE